MNIIIYTKTGCPWCEEVLHLLEKNTIPFEERECRSNPEYFQELIEKSGQTLTPTLDIDGAIIADTDAITVAAYLKDHGVPDIAMDE